MLPARTPATPADYSARSLRRHGRALSDAIGLTRAQVRVLCPELRNALGPIVYLAHVSTRGDDRTAAFKAVRRILALLTEMETRLMSRESRREIEAMLAGLASGGPTWAPRRRSRRVVHD